MTACLILYSNAKIIRPKSWAIQWCHLICIIYNHYRLSTKLCVLQVLLTYNDHLKNNVCCDKIIMNWQYMFMCLFETQQICYIRYIYINNIKSSTLQNNSITEMTSESIQVIFKLANSTHRIQQSSDTTHFMALNNEHIHTWCSCKLYSTIDCKVLGDKALFVKLPRAIN